MSSRSSRAVTVTVGLVAVFATAVVAIATWRRSRIDKRRKASMKKAQNVVWDGSFGNLPADKAVPLVDGAYLLAEGVVWCSTRHELWWLDINGHKIMNLKQHRTDAGDVKLVAEGWDVPKRPGSIALRRYEPGKEDAAPLLVAFEHAFCYFSPADPKLVPVVRPGDGAVNEYKQIPNSRLNDGKCDRQGRFICGGINLENLGAPADVWKPLAQVFRVEPSTGVKRILPDETFRCYNGTCFSPDGATMYAWETPLMTMNAYDYDTNTGEATNKRLLVDLEDSLPDGATVDAEGCIWVAIFGKGEVRRYSPEGELLRTIEVPGAKRTTCVAIGGPNLDILFITTASVGLTDQERMEQPNAGAVFAIRLEGIKGIPEPYYQG